MPGLKVSVPVIMFSVVSSLLLPASENIFAQSGYSDWLQGQMGEFQEYRDSRDREFVNFLKKEWHEFKVEGGLIRDASPKPVKRPVARELPLDKRVKPAPGSEKVLKKVTLPKEDRTKEPDLKNLPTLRKVQTGEKLEFDFFGTPVYLLYDRNLRVSKNREVSKKGISSFWKEVSVSGYEDFLLQMQEVREEMALNDWGYLLLAEGAGSAIFPEDTNTATLFAWFVMTKSGYETRIGFNKKHLYLLLPSNTVLYDTPNFMLDGTRFYAPSLQGKSGVGAIFTYKGEYPGADKKLDLTVTDFPKLSGEKKGRDLKFKYADREFLIKAEYNRASIDFFSSYPQTDLEVYFNSTISPEASYSLVKGLKPVIEGKGESEAVNIILRFVQTAFEYQTDGDQFGREKYFFREETLFYPFSDCEDRSILFAYLVKELTGLDVVVLDFPGHIATAVRFNEQVSGDAVLFNGDRYLICDPTYLNANVGMKMKKFEKIQPKIFSIKI